MYLQATKTEQLLFFWNNKRSTPTFQALHLQQGVRVEGISTTQKIFSVYCQKAA